MIIYNNGYSYYLIQIIKIVSFISSIYQLLKVLSIDTLDGISKESLASSCSLVIHAEKIWRSRIRTWRLAFCNYRLIGFLAQALILGLLMFGDMEILFVWIASCMMFLRVGTLWLLLCYDYYHSSFYCIPIHLLPVYH